MLCILRARRLCLFSGVISLCACVCVVRSMCGSSKKHGSSQHCMVVLFHHSQTSRKTQTFSRNRSAVISRCVSVNLELAQKDAANKYTIWGGNA